MRTTASTSPWSSAAMARASCGRSALIPLIFSFWGGAYKRKRRSKDRPRQRPFWTLPPRSRNARTLDPDGERFIRDTTPLASSHMPLLRVAPSRSRPMPPGWPDLRRSRRTSDQGRKCAKAGRRPAAPRYNWVGSRGTLEPHPERCAISMANVPFVGPSPLIATATAAPALDFLDNLH
jgi:hypothetical protein